MFISCSDARVVPELITSSEPGDIFVIRTAGNIVPPVNAVADGMIATIEYAVAVLAVREIAVCGHSNCGAMTAVATGQNLSGLDADRTTLRGWVFDIGSGAVEEISVSEAPLPSTDGPYRGPAMARQTAGRP